MPQKKNHKSIFLDRSRWLLALIGLILLVVGQYQISRSEPPLTTPTQLGIWSNEVLHLGIPSIDNVINGLPILIAGGILLLISLSGLQLLPFEIDQEEKKPVAFHLIAIGWPGIFCGLALFGATLLTLANRDFTNWMVIGWLISLLIFFIVIAIWDQRRKANLSPGLTRNDILWILGLVIIGLVIGTYRLQGVPDSLMGDDGSFWTTARDIATGTFKPPIFAVGVYTFPVLSSYIQAWAFNIFGITFWGWRFSSVVSGVATILPLYLLAREAFNRKVAIASSFALIFSPYFLSFSRLGYICIQALFITTLAMYWLYIGFKRASHLYLFLAGCASGLGFYTFFSARIAILICFAFIGLMWFGHKINFRKSLLALALIIMGFLLVSGPYLVYGISHDAGGMSYKVFESVFFNTFNGEQFYSDKELFAIAPPFQINGNTLFYNPKIYLVLIVRGLTRTLLAFQKPGLITEHFIASSLTGSVGALFYLFGLGTIIWKHKQPRSQLLLLWFFGVVFGLSALNTVPPRQTHMVSIIPALAVLTGMGLCTIANAANTFCTKMVKLKWIFTGLVITALILGGLNNFFLVMPDKYHPQPDEIMSWAVLYAQDESFYYIYSNPERKEFQPYIVTEFKQSVPFEVISSVSFDRSSLAFSGGKKAVIFYDPGLADKVEPIMSAQWGQQFIQKSFYSTGGVFVLGAGMNTPFVFVRDQSLLSLLKDSYLRPTFIILLAVLISLLVITKFFPVMLVLHIPKRLKRLVDWFNGPQGFSGWIDNMQLTNLEDILELSVEELPLEPPEWVAQIFPQNQVLKSEQIHAEFKQLKRENGKDFFVKVHVPRIRIMGFSLPGSDEFSFPAFEIPNPKLLTISILFAIVAQIMIFNSNSLAGIMFYLLSAGGLFSWIHRNSKWTNVFINQWHISPRVEKLLITLLIALTAFIRYYDLSYRVYGLGFDEIQWTLQSWFSSILMTDQGQLISKYIFIPLNFWIRSSFMRLFGLNFISPRIESATLSLISIIFLYLFVRKLTASKPLALLSTLLYSFSFVDLNIAHQALGQTTPEVWIISSFYFLVLALHERKFWQFQAIGIFLALGLMTSELFLPLPVFTIVYLAGICFFEIMKKKTSARKWMQYLFMVIWPIAIVYVVYTQGSINSLRTTDLAMVTQFSGNGLNFSNMSFFIVKNVSELFQTLFSHVVWTDSLINWGGPLINPIVLPFVVIGFITNMWNIRRSYFVLLPLWFMIFIVAGPISLGAVYPRGLYTILTPIMIWGAMGLWTTLGAIRAWFVNGKIKLAIPIFICGLTAITFIDHHIFTSALIDSTDGQKRRELADITTQSARNVPMVLYPFSSTPDDSLASELDIISLSMAGVENLGKNAEEHFKQLEFSQILSTLWEDRHLNSLDLFIDKSTNSQDKSNETLNIILRCYPNAILGKSGEFYDVYHFSELALNQPKCYQGAIPVTLTPEDGAAFRVNTPLTFMWDTNGVKSTSHAISLERKILGTYWIEVENNFVGTGWENSSAFVNNYSGSGFLLDGWQAGNAQYSFKVPEKGLYRIWIRSYKRRVNDQHNFITIEGNKVEFAGDTNMLESWVWNDIGKYSLSEGQLPLTLSRSYGKDEEYSVFIDTILITLDTVNPPDLVKIWESVVNPVEIINTTSQFIFPEILPIGDYRWKVQIFDGNILVDSNGDRGIESPFSIFTVTP